MLKQSTDVHGKTILIDLDKMKVLNKSKAECLDSIYKCCDESIKLNSSRSGR